MSGGLPEAATEAGLMVSGMVAVRPEDGLAAKVRSLALLSPDEPRFWPIFAASAEAQDGAPDPLDRWSRRIIGRIACTLGGKALFPFGGPPYRPFLDWTLRSGRAFVSPVGLLVHDTAGLFISYRGAIGLPTEAPAPPDRPAPCLACAAPCRTACPVGALTPAGYDVLGCRTYLRSAAGDDCVGTGCAVRRACPVGQGRRSPAQSAFHMRAFAP